MLQLQAVVALDSSKFTGGLGGLGAAVSNFSGAAMTMFDGVAAEIAAMYSAFGATGAAVAGLKDVISTGAVFEKSMANVQSVTGLAGDEFVRVSVATRDAAKATSFTAGQAAEAMYALGSSGISSAAVLEATLMPALKLAGATQSDTKLATEAMTMAMANWKLGAEDATTVADTFAGVIAGTPATMERLGDALKYAAPAGSAFGMSMKDTVDAIGAFHVVGLRGEMAGTAFRGALVELSQAAASGAGQVGAAMQGWSAETDGLVGAVKRLEEAGVPTSVVINEMGRRAGPGMAALVRLGSDAMGELSAKITSLSDVQKMYDIQMDTTRGKFDLFKASVEEAKIVLFTQMAPALQRTIELGTQLVDWLVEVTPSFKEMKNAISPLVTWFKNLDDSTKFVIAGIGGLGVAFGLVGPAVGAALAGMAAKAAIAFPAMMKSMLGFLVPALSGLLILSAAFAGFSLGQTVSNIKAGSDTIGGHLTTFFTQMIFEVEAFSASMGVYWEKMMLTIKRFVLEQAPHVVAGFVGMIAPMIQSWGDFRAWVLENLGMDEMAKEVREKSKDMADSFANFDSSVALDNVNAQLGTLDGKLDAIAKERAANLRVAMEMAGEAAKENLAKGIDKAEVFDQWLVQMDENGTELWSMIERGGAEAMAAFDKLVGSTEKAADATGAAGDTAFGAAGQFDVLAEATGPAATEMAKFGDEAIAFGQSLSNMKQKKLDEIINALRKFAMDMAGLPKLDLSWVEDFGKIRLPSLGGIQFFETDFKKLIGILSGQNVKGLNGLDFKWVSDLANLRLPQLRGVTSWSVEWNKLVSTVGSAGKISLAWLSDLSNFKLPESGAWSKFVGAFQTLANGISQAKSPNLGWLATIAAIDTETVTNMEKIAKVLSGLPTGTYNASIEIDWATNYTLQSIDKSLSKLAGMKGILWV